jgi:hypothetical protein
MLPNKPRGMPRADDRRSATTRRGILSSGHRKGGHVVRTVGDEFEPRIFSTHCPVAIAQIGKLPDTLADRSIQISMKRRTPGEAVSRLRGGHTPELAEAARKASALMGTNGQVTRLLSEA